MKVDLSELRALVGKTGLPWIVGNCEKTAGSSYHGEMYYRFDEGDWNIIPTGVAGPVERFLDSVRARPRDRLGDRA